MKGLLWFLFLLFLDVAIPYGVLSDYGRVTGAFIFWTVWGAIAVASIFFMTRRWGEER